jgi:hypothetical protein
MGLIEYGLKFGENCSLPKKTVIKKAAAEETFKKIHFPP